MTHRKSDHGRQSDERRSREDEAPRLHEQVPGLACLTLEIEDRCGVIEGSTYTRRIVVERAPALFLVPCGDARCKGGGYDLTASVMRALRAREAWFDGQDECSGSLGSGACARKVRFHAVASYVVSLLEVQTDRNPESPAAALP